MSRVLPEAAARALLLGATAAHVATQNRMRHILSPWAFALVVAVLLTAPGAALADDGTPPPQSPYTEQVPPCIVPALRGKTLRQAKIAIVKAGCKVGFVRKRVVAKAFVGRVVSQSPGRGKRLKGGARVSITLGRAAP